jgi:N-acetylglucosaminyl-diphospho-decaprenol L-rhamnosyltransferase
VTSVAVVTVVHGGHARLAEQISGLRRQARLPDLHVVVALEDPEVEWALGEHTAGRALPWTVEVVKVPAPGERGLPYAAAYNAGVTAAIEGGAGILALVDPACVPLPGFVGRHAAALEPRHLSRPERPVLSCGPVRSDPPGSNGREKDGSRVGRMAWSWAFATTSSSWTRLGGFDDAYLGHGVAELDLGERLRATSGTVLWSDEAATVRQHADDGRALSPADHLTNADRFARRWGRRPPRPWSTGLGETSVVERPDGGGRTTTRSGPPV